MNKIRQGVKTNDSRRGPFELSKNRENLVDLPKELDIKVGLIYRWRRELLDKGKGNFPGNGKPKQTPEEAEIAHLKKALKDAEMERDGAARCYYGWLNSEPSKRAVENQEILREINLIHKESNQTYGSPRISKTLKAKEIIVSRPRVARLMKQADLRAKRIKRFKVTRILNIAIR